MGGHSYSQENRSFRSADFQKKSASEKWELFHILPNIISDNSDEQWNTLLPERVLNVPIGNIPSVITKTIVNTVGNYLQTVTKQEPVSKPGENKTFL